MPAFLRAEARAALNVCMAVGVRYGMARVADCGQRGLNESVAFRPHKDVCKTSVSCITVLQDESVLPESQVLNCVAGLASVLELARTCDLYVITQCSSDATQDAVHRALCDNGVVDAGLNPHVRALSLCARCLVLKRVCT
jgi:hypothetical protein